MGRLPAANESILWALDFVRESLPASLVDDAGYARLAAVAERLPLDLTTFWGFECPLSRPDAVADILFHTAKGSLGHRLLAGQTASSLDAFCDGSSPCWQALRAFARLWAEPDHPFYAHVYNIWLEFDTGAASSAAEAADLFRQPNVFFGLNAKPDDHDALLRVVPNALDVLSGGKADTCGLAPLIESLPAGGRLFQIGLMLARSGRGLRACVDQLGIELVPEWLTGLKWQGDVEALSDFLRRLAPLQHSMAVDLDVTHEGVAEKVGLECYVNRRADDPSQWPRLLGFVEDIGLCLPEKRRDLLDFPGSTRPPTRPRTSDVGVVYLDITRAIHHVKLAFDGGRAVEAKGYLAVYRPGINLRGLSADAADPGASGASGGGWHIE